MLKKRIANVVLVISIVVYLYYLCIMLFNPPTDFSDIAQLKIRSSVSAGIMAIAAFIRVNIKSKK